MMCGQWRRNLLSRFGDREDLGKAKAYQQYWAELPERDVMELFELLEMEFQLPPGLLRPGDNLNKLLEPVATTNPLKWLLYRARTEDRTAEISHRLSKRQQQQGTRQPWQQAGIATVDDLVRAWCGLLPRDQLGESGRKIQ